MKIIGDRPGGLYKGGGGPVLKHLWFREIDLSGTQNFFSVVHHYFTSPSRRNFWFVPIVANPCQNLPQAVTVRKIFKCELHSNAQEMHDKTIQRHASKWWCVHRLLPPSMNIMFDTVSIHLDQCASFYHATQNSVKISLQWKFRKNWGLLRL